MINYSARIKFLTSYLKHSNLTLQFNDDPSEMFAVTIQERNGQKIFNVPRPKVTWNSDQWAKWEMLFMHEAGHHRRWHADLFPIIEKEKINMNSTRGIFLNIVDDFVQELDNSSEFIGVQEIMDRGYRALEKLTQKLRQENVRNKDTPETVLAMWFHNLRNDWIPSFTDILDEVEFTDKEKKWLSALDNYRDDVYKVSNKEEELKLSDRILKEVFDLDKDEANKDKNENQLKKIMGELANILADIHKIMGNEKVTSESVSKREKKNNQFTENVPIRRGNNNFIIQNIKEVDQCASSSREIDKTNIDSIAKKILPYLLINSKTKYEQGKRSGKLVHKKLYKIKEESPLTPTIFKRPIEGLSLDCCVYLLCDGSGSMQGRKIRLAFNTGYHLGEALNKLQIPFQFTVFSEYGQTTYHKNIKKFNTRWSEEDVWNKTALAYHKMGGNNDGLSVLHAAYALMPRTEKRKFLWVISDGQPASGNGYYDAHDFLIYNLQKLERETNIEVVGIGIHHDVSPYYKRYINIQNVNELEPKLLKLLKERLINV